MLDNLLVSWMKKLLGEDSRRSRRQRQDAPRRRAVKSWRPRLETLEDRLAPALWIVNVNTDAAAPTAGMLRYAINTSVAGDTIEFASSLSGQSITLVSPLTIAHNLTIIGLDSATSSITVNGNNTGVDFIVNTGVTASISNLTITGGVSDTGNGIRNSGTLALSDDAIISDGANGNTTSDEGGGIYNVGTLDVNDCAITTNCTYYNGGAIENNTGGVMTVTDTTMSNNLYWTDGGAIYNLGTATLSNDTMNGNNTGSWGAYAEFGGGIFNSGTVNMVNTIVSGNTATMTGPDIDGTVAVATNCVIGTTTGYTITTSTGNLTGTPASLGTLGANGGPTNTQNETAGSNSIAAGTAVTTVGAGGIGAAGNSLPLTNAAYIGNAAISPVDPLLIQIGTEQMLVTAVSTATNTATVIRGYNGTTAAAHAAAANVFLYLDQRGYATNTATPDVGAYQNTGTAPGTPTITSVSPNSGPLAGGTNVTITGTNLANATGVFFGGVPATIVSDSGTQIVATSPAEAAGTVDITVTTVGWDTSSTVAADQFTYSNGPTYTYAETLGAAPGALAITMTVPTANSALTLSLNAGVYTISDTGGLLFGTPTGAGAGNVTGATTATITIPAADLSSISITDGTGTNTFNLLGTNGASAVPLTVNAGTTAGDAISISGASIDSGAVSLTGNTIAETGTGALNAGANAVTLNATTTITQAAAGLITSGALTITAGSVGAAAQSLVINATSLTSTTAASNGQQWFKDTATVSIPTAGALNSGTGGIWFEGGTFKDGVANAITGTNSLYVDTPAIFDLNGFSQTLNALNDTGTVTDSGAAATLTISNGGTFSGSITGANLGLTLTGAAATFILSGTTNTYGGATNVQGGTLKAGANNAFSPSSAVALGAAATAGTLDLAGFNETVAGLSVAAGATAANQTVGNSSTTANATLTVAAGTSTYAGIIKNVIGSGTKTIGLTVSGGSLTLTGADTYTGATAVSAGTLLVNSPGTIATSSGVAVSGTGILGGSGAVPAITATGGTVDPGAAIGTPGVLTAGVTNLSGGGNLTLDIAGLTTPGTTYSQLSLGANNLTLGGTSSLTLNLAGLAAAGTATQTIVMTTGTITGTFASTNVTNGAGYAAYVSTYAASSITITIYTPTATSIVVASGSPQNATVNTAFTNPLVATVLDQHNVPMNNVSVTFTAPAAAGASGIFSNATQTITANTNALGQLSEAFTANTHAGSYTVTATTAGVAAPANFSLTNNPGAPASIVVASGSPQSTTVNTPFANLVVTVFDTYGNPVPGASVTFLAPVTNPSGTFSNATNTITAPTNASGQLSEAFTANTHAGGPYTVSATVGAFSTNFSLTNNPGAATQLVITTQPSGTATAGNVFATQPVVAEEDQYGNILTGDSTHTITAVRNLGTASLLPLPLTTVTLVNGVGTFSGLVYDKAETMNIKFSTNAGAFTAVSTNVVVSPNVTTAVGFTVQPSNVTAGSALAPPVQAAIEDAYGNVETADNSSTLSIAIASGPGAFTSGSTTVGIVSAGIATFNNLVLDTAGTYTVTASDALLSITSAPSSSFQVNAVTTPAQIVFGVQPTNVTAGAALSPVVTAKLEDQYGNVETTDNSSSLSIAIASGPTGAAFVAGSTTTATVSAGVATFTTLKLNTAGSYTLQVSDAAPALTSASSNSFTVSAAAAAQIVFGQQPTSTTAGVAITPAVTVQVEDTYGNIVTTDNISVISVSINSGPAGGVFTGGSTTQATAHNGVASLGNLVLDTAGTYTLAATDLSLSLTAPASNNFLVAPSSATQVIFGQQPTNVSAGQPISPLVTAKIEDGYGNVETGDSSSTVSLTANGPGSFTTTSITSATVTNGIATFGLLALNLAGAYTLGITATGGLTGPNSAAFSVTPSQLHLVFGTQPSNTTAGQAVATVTVDILDQFNALVTTDNTDAVSLAVVSGPGGFAPGSTTTVISNGGVATFFSLVFDKVGTYVLSENANDATGPNSNTFQITVGSPSQLAFNVQPSATFAGVAVNPTVQVAVEDAYGNVVTGNNSDGVTLSIASGPGTFAVGSTPGGTAASGVATFSTLLLNTAGTYTLRATDSLGLTQAISSGFVVSPNTATQILFGQQPTALTAGGDINPGVTVKIEDQYGNVETNDNSSTLSIAINSGPAGAAFAAGSNAAATVVGGIATFPALGLDTAGAYTLKASDSSPVLSTPVSNGFIVSPAAPAQIVFGVQPTNVAAGSILAPAITAKLEDAYGNVETNDSASNLNIAIATGPVGASFASGSTVSGIVSAGIATFSALKLDTAGTYTLQVSDASPALTSPGSLSFVVSPIGASQLVFGQQPSNATAGVTLGPPVTVKIEDPYGNVETGDNTSSLSIAIASGPAGGTLASGSTTSASVSGGVATFSTLTFDTAGAYTLQASDAAPSLASAPSGSFVISPNSATQLVYGQQPTTTPASSAISPSVTVKIEDAYGNVETGNNSSSVTLGIASGPGGGVFAAGAVTTVTVSAGVATFGTVILDTVGTYTLSESATGGLTGPNSGSFQITPASGGYHLAFNQGPTAVVAGVAISPSVTVRVLDSFGNLVTTDNTDQVSLAVASGPGNFAGSSTTTVTVSGGVATFNNLVFDAAGTYTLSESATGGLVGLPSGTFVVSPAAISHLTFNQQPSSTSAGFAIDPAVSVRVVDQFGNLVTTDNSDQVTIGIATGPGGFTVTSSLTATASGGIATFNNLVLDTAGLYTLSESGSGGLVGLASSLFQVIPVGATQLGFDIQPTTTTAGVAISPAVTVRVLDMYGNTVTTDNTDQVTLTVASGPGGFAGSSTTSATVVAGVATFSNLVLDATGSYTLGESATGSLSGPASNSFTITPATATHVVFSQQPTTTTAGAAVNPAVSVRILDAFNNLVTTDNTDQVTLSLVSGPGGFTGTSTPTVTASGGIATFGNLVLDTTGVYILSEQATGGLAGPNSNSFSVTPATATHLAFVQQPGTTTAGNAVSAAPTVDILDAYNNLVTTDSIDRVVLGINSGPGSFTGGSTTSVMASGGVASFANLVLDTAGSYTLTENTTGGLSGVASSSFTVNPAIATQVVIGQQPTNASAGAPLAPQVTAKLEDQYGNVETGDNASTLSIAIVSGPIGAAFAGGSTTSDVVTGGVATFTTVAFDTAGSYTMLASDAALGFHSPTSGSFTISPGTATQLIFAQQPTTSTAGVALSPAVSVKLEDQYGNVETGDNATTLTIGVASGPGNFTGASTTSAVVSAGVATFAPLTLTAAGSYTLTAADAPLSLTSAASNNFVITPASAAKLAIGTQPTTTVAGDAVSPGVTARVLDAYNNLVTSDNTDVIRLTISSGPGPFTSTSTTSVTASGGIATFTNLAFNSVGSYVLSETTAGGLSGPNTNSFQVVSALASKLTFAVQPVTTTAGVAVSPAVTVDILDQFGNLAVADNTDQVTLAIASGPGSFAAGTTATVTASGGVATFSNLVLDTTGSYTLSATATGGLSGPSSSSFTITPAAATHLIFSRQPSVTSAGSAVSGPVTVSFLDAYNNVVTTDNTDQVSLAVATGPGGFTGSSTTTATASAGVASFGNLVLDTAGSYTLSENATGALTGPASSAFTVTPVAANHLAFGIEPGTAVAGAPASTVTVRVLDQYGNVVTGDNSDQVTLTVASGPGGFAGASTTTANVVGGVATFNNLILDTTGTYTLSESATGSLSGANSTSFTVTPSSATHLVFSQQPTSTVAGVAVGPAVTVRILDAYNNLVTNDNTDQVTLALVSGPAGFTGTSTTTVTAASGMATFSNLVLDTTGTYVLSERATGGLSGTNSSTFPVTPSTATHLAFTQEPGAATAGVALSPAVTVSVLDAFGNVVTTDSSDRVTLSIAGGPGTFAAGSTTTVIASSGVATFANLVLDTAGNYVLGENSAGGLSGLASSNFTVSPNTAAQIAFGQQPVNAAAGVALSPMVTAMIEDQFGNVETGDNASTLTIAIAGGPTGAAIAAGSTTSAEVSGGVATFAALSFDTAGNYTLIASDAAPSLDSPASNAFTIDPNTPTQIIFGQQPTTTTAGAAITPAVSVMLEDQFGNVESNDNASTLTLGIASGPAGASFAAGASVIVNSGVATFTNATLTTVGTYTLTATDAAISLSSTTSNSFVVNPGAAAKLAIGQQPGTTAAGAVINPAVTVDILDAYNNIVTGDSSDQVSLAVASGPGGLSAGSTATVTASKGVATFTNLALDKAGSYALSESATSGLSGPDTNSFQVVSSGPSQLAFGVQPATTVAGVAISPAVTVRILDQFGNLVTGDNADQVTLSIASGPGGFAAGSTTTVTASGGIATFANLLLDTTGTYTLSAAAKGGISGPASSSFTIVPAAANHLVFSQQPTATSAGVAVNPAVSVSVFDAFNNLVTTDNTDQISIGVASGPGGFTPGSTATATASAGVATFTNLVLDTAGAYSLSESGPGGLTGLASTPFQVNSVAPTQIVFGVEPTATTAGVAVSPAVTVRILDQFGNLVTGDNSDQVTLAVASGPGSFAGSSTTKATVVGGVAMFNNLVFDGAGSYTLSESATGSLTGPASISFAVTPAAATHLVFGQQPTNTTAGVAINPDVTVRILDAFNNLVTADNTDQVTLSVASGSGTLTGASTATVTASAGVATFSNLVLDTAGNYVLSEQTAGGLTGTNSKSFAVTPATATHLAFAQEPGATTAGVAVSPAVTVDILDAFGNVVTSDNTDRVILAVGSGPGSFTGSSTTSLTASNGVAVFPNLVFDTAGNYSLTESTTGGLSGAASSTFTVNPAAALQVVFGQQPTSASAGAALTPQVTAKIEDSFGNVETGDNASTLSLAIASGPTGASFAAGSTASAVVTGGVATFTNLLLDTAGAYTLLASDASPALHSPASSSFTISPSTPTQLIFGQQPTNATAGAALVPPVSVKLEDKFGNVETGDSASTLTIGVADGPAGASFTGGSTTSAVVNAGIATFPSLTLDTAGTYTLAAADSALSLFSQLSNDFVVSPAAAAKLAIGQQPVTTTAGVAVSPAVSVRILDAFNNVVTDDSTDQVDLTVASGPGGLTGASTSTVTASNGIATFTNLVFDTAGSYTLGESTQGGLAGPNTNSFQIVAAAPSQLTFGVQPSTTVAGLPVNPAVTVELLDQFGNLAASDNSDQVTLSVASGPAGFAGGSTTKVTTSGGVATFGNLVLDTTGTYALSAAATGGLGGPASSSFTVTANTPTHLAFSQQPTTTTVGTAINPAVTVSLLDAYNNVVTTDSTDQVSIALGSGPGGFTGSSTTTATFSSGVATFSNLVPNTQGPSDALKATASVGSVVSNPFNVRNPISPITVTSSLNPAIFGQPVSLTVTITGAGGTPSGAVSVLEGGVTLAAGSLNSAGTTTIALPLLSAGAQQDLVVNYGGDSLFAPLSSDYLQTVNKAGTTLALAPTTASIFGQAVTFTANVGVVSPGAGSVSGDSVTFMDGSTVLGTGTIAGNQATFTTTLLSAGSHSITAVFGPTANFASSTATAVTQTVSPSSTATTLQPPAVTYYGQSITFVANVAASTGAPVTGTVTFLNGAAVLGAAAVSGGSASLTISGTTLPVSPLKGYQITASFAATNNLLASASSPQTQLVDQVVTSVNLTSSTGGQSVVGQSVTFTAAIEPMTSGAGAVTGKVTFSDNGKTLATVPVNANGDATYTTSVLALTSHTITASYSGATDFTSSSQTLSQTVGATQTAVTLSSSQSLGSFYGQLVTFTAMVGISGPGAGKLTGSVSFFDGTTLLATKTISANGLATYTTASLAGGTDHQIFAVYSGAATLTQSSNEVDQVVAPAVTTTTLTTASVAYWSVNTPINFSTKVTAAGLKPTGTVTFNIDGVDQTPVPIVNGSATFNFPGFTTSGPHSVSVTYNPDTTNFATSTSATLNRGAYYADSIALTGPSGTPTPGQAVTVTATVSGNSVVPTGVVTFYDGKKLLKTVTLDGNGDAVLSLASLSTGSHSITAVYSGDDNYAPKTSNPLLLGGRLV